MRIDDVVFAGAGAGAGVDAAAGSLRAVLGADRVLIPGPAEGEGRERPLWNGAVPHRPAIVALPRTAAEVRAAVLAARDAGLPLSVMGGGHDWAGRAVRVGGLVIDLSGMRQVTVDPSSRTACVEGGATAGDVIDAGAPYGLVAATGTVHSVGLTGLTLGGGYGPLNGLAGLALDNLVSADVILADGRLVTADAHQEPELFWALRGGGGNFGVVTSLRVRLHAVPRVLGGFVTYPLEAASGVWERLCAVLAESPDELTVPCGVMTGEEGEPLLFLAPVWSGDHHIGERAVGRLLGLAARGTWRVGETTYRQVLAQNDAWASTGGHYEIATRNVSSFGPEVAAVLCEAGATATSPLSAVPIHHFHGAASRVPVEETAFGLRRDHFLVELVAAWRPGDPGADRHRAWAASVDQALAPYALPGGYANLLTPGAGEQVAHAYGPNAARLLAAKRCYDPDGVFCSLPLPAVG
ncbi:FAD-binding oxidoreductase [Streptomyces sp. ODS05-4]|uniref:FAD-binding oxidoreductase n=1 Tax=Streptomyces sp. ODS05-4 TaxID=2944939 RepID=UPI00210C999C|nr:FAD-binding oxidoreductase [Streptomyces sp. ODS05-4]